MFGKQKCRILKEIRQRIADENDIPYVTSECGHRGNCSGTCPRCESELRYLERQLALRTALGKRVSVAALCAGLALTAAGCAPADAGPGAGPDLAGETVCETPSPTAEPEIEVTMGEVAWPEENEPLDGEILPGEETPRPRELELSGYVAYSPEESRHG